MYNKIKSEENIICIFKQKINMTEKIYTKDEIREIVKPIAQSRKIDKVFLFGSYARNEATKDSDLDFCIDAPSIRSLFTISGVRMDLCNAFGKDIDLITMSSLQYNKDIAFVEAVNRERELVYG